MIKIILIWRAADGDTMTHLTESKLYSYRYQMDTR